MADLAGRVRTGVGWTAASTVTAQTMGVLRSVVLARLLTQAEFGLYGMALTFTEALNVLTNLNLNEALIVSRTETEAEQRVRLNTLWTAELVRRLLLACLIALAAWPAAHFYGETRLLWILPLLGLRGWIEGFQNIGLTLLRREVRFARLFWFEQTTLVLYTLATCYLAWKTRDVWAFVGSQLIHITAWVLLSYGFHPYRPRFRWDRVILREATQFGKPLLLGGLMAYIVTTADNVVIGKLWGVTALGSYVAAYALGSLPLVAARDILGRVAFPAFAELARAESDQLARAIRRGLTIGGVLLMLVTVPLLPVSEEFIRLLYGAKWHDAGVLLRLLLIAGLLRGLAQLVTPLFLSLGHPVLEARLRVGEALLFLALLLPFTAQWGAIGAAWAGILAFACSGVVRYGVGWRHLPSGFREALPRLGSILLMGLVAIGGGIGARQLALATLPRLGLGGGTALLLLGLCFAFCLPELRAELSAIRQNRAIREKGSSER